MAVGWRAFQAKRVAYAQGGAHTLASHTLGAGLTSSLVLLRFEDCQVRSRRKGWHVRLGALEDAVLRGAEVLLTLKRLIGSHLVV